MKLESMLTTGEIMSGSLQDEIKQLKDEKNSRFGGRMSYGTYVTGRRIIKSKRRTS